MIIELLVFLLSSVTLDYFIYAITVIPVGLVFLGVMAFYDFKVIPYELGELHD